MKATLRGRLGIVGERLSMQETENSPIGKNHRKNLIGALGLRKEGYASSFAKVVGKSVSKPCESKKERDVLSVVSNSSLPQRAVAERKSETCAVKPSHASSVSANEKGKPGSSTFKTKSSRRQTMTVVNDVKLGKEKVDSDLSVSKLKERRKSASLLIDAKSNKETVGLSSRKFAQKENRTDSILSISKQSLKRVSTSKQAPEAVQGFNKRHNSSSSLSESGEKEKINAGHSVSAKCSTSDRSPCDTKLKKVTEIVSGKSAADNERISTRNLVNNPGTREESSDAECLSKSCPNKVEEIQFGLIDHQQMRLEDSGSKSNNIFNDGTGMLSRKMNYTTAVEYFQNVTGVEVKNCIKNKCLCNQAAYERQDVDSLDETITEIRDEVNYSFEDVADLTLTASSAETEILNGLSRCSLETLMRTEPHCWLPLSKDAFGNNGMPCIPVGNTSSNSEIGLDAPKIASKSGFTMSSKQAKEIQNSCAENPRVLVVGSGMYVGDDERQIEESCNVSGNGDASSDSNLLDCKQSARETSDSDHLASTWGCEPNAIALSSFLRYANRLSLQPTLLPASPPLDLLTDSTSTTTLSTTTNTATSNISSCSRSANGSLGESCQTKTILETKLFSKRPGNLLTNNFRSRLSSGIEEAATEMCPQKPTYDEPETDETELAVIESGDMSSQANCHTSSDTLPSGELDGLMSLQFVPKRPLSQVCSRTIQASHLWKVGNILPEGGYAMTSGSTGNPWKSACSVSAQIQAARSYSHKCRSNSISQHERTLDGELPFPRTFRFNSVGSCPVSVPRDFPTHGCFNCCAVTSTVDSTGIISSRSQGSTSDCDKFGSATSLKSNSSSFVSMVEEKQTIEIRKLKQELDLAKEKIASLSRQLNMNAVLSTSYEQQFESMTRRQRHLAFLLEEKNSELLKLRSSVTDVHSADSGVHNLPHSNDFQFLRQKSSSVSSFKDLKAAGASLSRHGSYESVGSFNSQLSYCSATSQPGPSSSAVNKKLKKRSLKNSLRLSFFGRKHKHIPAAEIESNARTSPTGLPYKVPFLNSNEQPKNSQNMTFHESIINDLQKQLRERDAEVMDLKLNALASAQQAEQLREMVALLKREIACLKMEQTSLKKQLSDLGDHQSSSRGSSSCLSNNVQESSMVFSVVSSADQLSASQSYDSHTSGSPLLGGSPGTLSISSPKLLQKFTLKCSTASGSGNDSHQNVKLVKVNVETRGQRQTWAKKEHTDSGQCYLPNKATDLNQSCNQPSASTDGSRGKSSSSSSSSSDVLKFGDQSGCSKLTLLQSTV